MKKRIQRKLAPIFGLAKKRDALLGELLYTIKNDGYGQRLVELTSGLAYLYNQSDEVARCLDKVVDHVADMMSAGRGFELANIIANKAGSGPVYLAMLPKLPDLKRIADIEHDSKREMLNQLDRIRAESADRPFMRTHFCYQAYDRIHPSRKVTSAAPLPPYKFIEILTPYR